MSYSLDTDNIEAKAMYSKNAKKLEEILEKFRTTFITLERF